MSATVRVLWKDLVDFKTPRVCASCGESIEGEPVRFTKVRESLAGAFLLVGWFSFMFTKTVSLPVCEKCSSSWGKPAKIDSVVFGKTAKITFKCDSFAEAFRKLNNIA